MTGDPLWSQSTDYRIDVEAGFVTEIHALFSNGFQIRASDKAIDGSPAKGGGVSTYAQVILMTMRVRGDPL
ncbi:hypothetical protein CupriaWKF_04310 [Cupriavidus sp. WKF15]|uniref:hypothetical protein n=1 Tax=Cupriavidus sp. WKF15 TaxID=3032282 RepID=UPI0023E0D96C|nr:hypothetical protein [Cupriavidus sp. WKF15]WER46812.1 hypothetical protein CupriaWKF_04310 [Cupriavidus sp. WKF15]